MKAKKLISLDDFNEYVSVEQELIEIAKSTARSVGDQFFISLARSVQKALKVGFVLIGRVVTRDNESVQTIVLLKGQEILPNVTYCLRGTPCENVVRQKICYHPRNIQQEYPDDTILVDLDIESYLGYPMIDVNGKTLGVLAVLDTREISEEQRTYILSILWVLASRGAAEIYHQKREANLENIIETRTNDLVAAQMKLIEQDKMAALGKMVAGFSHEVNTPIGVAITASSGLNSIAQEVEHMLNEDKVSRTKLLSLANKMVTASQLVDSNLYRAAELIRNFKRVSIDLSEEHYVTIVLADQLDALIKAYNSVLTAAKLNVICNIDPGLTLVMPSGVLGQVFSNLLINTMMHAYPNGEQGTISITARRSFNVIAITYQDDGIGLAPDIANCVFEPFVTTKRAAGGTGLGMYIVYTIITKLGGEVAIDPHCINKGFKIEIQLPLHIKINNKTVKERKKIS